MGKSLAIRIVNILFISIFALSILLGVVFMVNLNENMLLIWTYALTVVAVGLLVVFGLANMFKSKKSIITSLIMLGVTAVLVGISYVLASDALVLDVNGDVIGDITNLGSKWSGATLYLLYILLGLSFISLIFAEIRGAFK
jgi:hypothetical protein